MSRLRRQRKMRSCLRALLIFFCSVGLLGCSGAPRENHYAYKPNPANEGASVEAHIEFLEKRLQTRPKSWLEQAELAGYYMQRARSGGSAEDYEQARQWAEKSASLFPNPAAQMIRADLLQTEHKFVESLALLEEVLEKEPGNVEARLTVIKVLLAQGEGEKAAEQAQNLPDHPLGGLSFARGRVEEARGNIAQARTHFQRALQLEGRSGSAREAAMLRAVWARMEMENGDLEAASALLESAKGISVGLPLLEFVRGELAQKQENLEEAIRIYRGGFALYHDPVFLLRLSEVQRLKGDEARASETLSSAVELMKKDAFGHERDLAEALLQLNAEENAEQIKALMKTELERRQDKETLRIQKAVEEKLGS